MDIRNTGSLFLRVDTNDGETWAYPIQSFAYSYSINQIPTATVRLNTGRAMRTNRLSSVHSEAGAAALREMNKASIVGNFQGPFDSTAKRTWDDVGDFVLFEGRIAGIAPLMTHGTFAAEVSLLHWLGDLAFSSAASEQIGHGNYAAMATRAVFQSPGAQANTGKPSFIALYGMAEHVLPDRIQSDLWGDALHKAFSKLIEADPLSITAGDQECVISPDGTGNQVLKDALSRFDGSLTDGKNPRSTFYRPLQLQAASGLVAKSIAEYLMQVLNSTLHGTSIWAKLLEMSGPLAYTLIPSVDRATLAPMVLGLRQTFQKKIVLNHLDQLQPEQWNNRPIRSSVVLAGRVGSASAFAAVPDGRDGVEPLDRGALIGGCYVPADGPERGLVLTSGAPVWLDQVPALTSSPGKTAGEAGAVGNQTSKTGKNPALRGDRDGKTPADAVTDIRDMYRAYARYQYITEVLRNRSLVVTVPTIRQDIGVGSSVEVQGPFDEPLFGRVFYGTVVRVTGTMQVTGQRLSVQTQFRISGIRRDSENDKDALSIEAHPLYSGEQFTGLPLNERLLFGD